MTAPTRQPATSTPASSIRATLLALTTDAILVVVFAAIGRASHDEGLSLWGVGMTAMPFLLALVVGWAVSLGWRQSLAPLRTGVPVWLVTVVGGMLLRTLLGQGTALPFVIVATLTLLLMLVGWRAVAALVRRRR